ncbi:flagellar protein FlaG [Lamprobacter modestohalophilus]|uniref:flagellar protein FlaG n=1 Tax=Lamprobacter modestohalophilus TaxID=1064514 RepID=UPI001903EBE7|nr:flagellar protein FlaG [Lamprobacter modestohalophilus]
MEGLLQALPSVGSTLAQAESNQAPGRSDLEEPLQRVNEVMNNDGVQFEMSEPPGERLITRIVDSESGDVIRQIPPEEMMRLVEQIAEMTQAGRGGLVNLEA